MTEPIVTCEQVSKRFRIPQLRHHGTLRGRILHPLSRTVYRDLDALRSVSFSVRRGEFFGIVGRNGSGKSTLLKVLAGIYRPDSGAVRVDGTLAPFIELGVGFNDELSGRDNLYVNGALLGLSRKQLQRRYDAIVDFAELHEFMDLKLRNFSSGIQVRLAFSIAIESGTDILLVDEVLAVGDERFQRKCYEVFRERKRIGQTLVFVSHDMAAVEQFCDRALLLEQGSQVELDAPRTVTRAYHRLNLPQAQQQQQHEEGDSKQPASVVETWTETASGERSDTLQQGERMLVKVRVRFAEELAKPTVGITLRNRLGTNVCLMNTLWAGCDTGAHGPGSQAVVCFAFQNLLAADTYWINAEVAHAAGGDIFEAVLDAAQFATVADRATQGVVDLPYEVQIDSHDRPPDAPSAGDERAADG